MNPEQSITEIDQAEGHFRVAEQQYEEALKIYNEHIAQGHTFMPAPGAHFRDPRLAADFELREALNGLDYAEQFGMAKEETGDLREKILELLKKL